MYPLKLTKFWTGSPLIGISRRIQAETIQRAGTAAELQVSKEALTARESGLRQTSTERMTACILSNYQEG
jgi:hypothetical protein